MAVNASFVSPTADAKVALHVAQLNVNGVLSTLLNNVSVTSVLLTLLMIAVAYDQFKYIWNKGSIVGPAWKAPFIGPFLESVNPKFTKYHEKWLSGPLSCVSVFHKFVVIASTRDLARKVLNSPTFVKPCVVDAAYKILRPTNWVFLDGKAHVDYRKGLNGLFTRQALSQYLPGQEEVLNKYFKKWTKITQDNDGKHTKFMPEFRELMTALSCRTFVGHYMSEETVMKIDKDYYLITEALELVNFPIIIPFSKTWYGKKAADMVLEEFTKCAAKAKVRMAAGGEKECVLDFWVAQMYESEAWRQKVASGEEVDPNDKPKQLLRMFTDFEISMTLLTFLFASQDATSSAATWLFQIMADRPEFLAKVREENIAIRKGDIRASLTLDQLETEMPWTRAVVKEELRYRPPVIMVPYKAKKDFPITPEYTIPKGSMVVPTTYLALHDPEAYPDPESYVPERWITGDADKQTKNWLVFGVGPHYCLGQVYAQANLMLMIGMASMLLDWDHKITEKSEEIKVFATIFPMDDCLLTFKDSERATQS